MNAKIILMSALLGGASVLSIVACSSDDSTAKDDGTTTDKDASAGGDSSTTPTTDSGTTAPTCGDGVCGQICKQATAAKCKDQGAPVVKTCEQSSQLAALAPSCTDKVDAAMKCLGTATFTCKEDATTTEACQTELKAASDCVTSVLTPDAGGESDAGDDAGDAS